MPKVYYWHSDSEDNQEKLIIYNNESDAPSVKEVTELEDYENQYVDRYTLSEEEYEWLIGELAIINAKLKDNRNGVHIS